MGLVRAIRRRKFSKVVAWLIPGCHQVPNKTAFKDTQRFLLLRLLR